MVIHEHSYKGMRLSSVIHRARLRNIIEVMRSLSLPPTATIADFGCSNGFFLSVLLDSIPEARSMELFGFDHSRELLVAAQSKDFPNAQFHYVDLNARPAEPHATFDVVTCFETLEHVGNMPNAMEKLLASCKTGGTIVISVPNEIGIPGLMKYVGRKVGRPKPYGAFFENQSELRYIWHLITGKSTATFRSTTAVSWGPHLGFDWRLVENYLSNSDSCEIVRRHNLVFGLIFVLRKG